MKVVSFCLYGTQRHYQTGAIRNVELCKQVYPGWEIWIYASPTIPKNILTELKLFQKVLTTLCSKIIGFS